MKNLLVLGFLIGLTLALYEANSPVFKLTEQNFKSTVLESDQFWLVEFYAPWCGHCKKAAPEYQQASLILKGIVNLGAVDMTTDQAAGSRYGISGYPTIKLFGNDKNKPIDFSSGDRSFQSFVNFSMDQLKQQIKSRKASLKNNDDELL